MITKEEAISFNNLIKGVDQSNEQAKDTEENNTTLPEGITEDMFELMLADATMTILLRVIENQLNGWDAVSTLITEIYGERGVEALLLLIQGLSQHFGRVEEIKQSQGFRDFVKSK